MTSLMTSTSIKSSAEDGLDKFSFTTNVTFDKLISASSGFCIFRSIQNNSGKSRLVLGTFPEYRINIPHILTLPPAAIFSLPPRDFQNAFQASCRLSQTSSSGLRLSPGNLRNDCLLTHNVKGVQRFAGRIWSGSVDFQY